MWKQNKIKVGPYKRGFHLITREVINGVFGLDKISIGIMHVNIMHTSASLTINENADSTVRDDFESHLNKIVPENEPHYKHTLEGPDDMPAHIKSSLLGSSLSIPINNGRVILGTWQGIYLCEHRNNGGQRSIVITVSGG